MKWPGKAEVGLITPPLHGRVIPKTTCEPEKILITCDENAAAIESKEWPNMACQGS